MKKKRESGFLTRGNWQKILWIMQLKVLLILISCFQVTAAVHSQNKLLDVQLENVSLEQVIWELEKKTDLTFMYWTNEIKEVKNLSLSMKQKTISDILDFCLRDTDLRYEINGDAVVIHRVKDEKPENKNKVIRGVVKDKQGQALPGVTVLVKGTSIGVATDIDGKFTMTATRDTMSLLFSFVGMRTKEVTWKGEALLTVVLEDDAKQMDEVVVTGYQTVKKSNMAGSVSTVKAEDLVLNGTQSLEQALQGKLPGVLVTNSSGLVGTRQKVRVRGTSTLLGSQEPVWVVDGIIQQDPLPFKAEELTLFGKGQDNMDVIRNFVGSAIAWLNPSDIKDITVLKDASATAIYGVKAANGVIMITTKKGVKGRLSINYTGNFSIGSKVTYDKLELMNSKERVDVSKEIFEKGLVGFKSLEPVGFSGLLSQYLEDKINYDEFNAGVKKLEVVNTDWFDLLFENPFSHSHSLSISGGSDKTTYYASFGMNTNNGTAKGNDSQSYSGSVSLNSMVTERLQVSARVAGNVTETNGFNQVDPYSYASTTSRVISAFDDNGELSYYRNRNGYRYNVLNELHNTGNKNTTSTLSANMQIAWEMLKGLKLESTFNYSYTSSYGESYATEYSNYITAYRGYEFGAYTSQDVEYQKSMLPHGGELTVAENRNAAWTWKNILSYVKNWDTHLLTLQVGQESSSSKYDGLSENIFGYIPSRGKTIVNPPAQIVTSTPSKDEVVYGKNMLYNNLIYHTITDKRSNNLSFFGTMTYTYDERYVLNASIRTDASNRFGQDKSARYQPIWSVGLRWNLGREHFMENQDFVNEFSLRASYGVQGNASEAAGPDLIAYIPSGSTGVSTATGEYLLKMKSLPNPYLKWEKTMSYNLGADFVLWKNKISGTFEYWKKKGEDIIVNKQVPLENGILSMPMNGGTMENSGWELGVSFAPVRTKDFVWSLSLNTSKTYNELTSELESNMSWEVARSGSLYKKGYPVSGFWAFDFTGISPKDGSPEFNLYDFERNALADKDATQYMKYMGRMEPDFSAGMSTSFRYKTWTLSASFNIQLGGKKFLAPVFNGSMLSDLPSEYQNLPKELVNRWREAGDEAKTQIPSLPDTRRTTTITFPSGSTYTYAMYNFSDIRVAKASFLRCNNISLSYSIPPETISKFAQSIGFNFSVSNPFILVSKDFKGKDPEVATGSQPITQNYTFSINISF